MLSNEKWFGASAGFYPETIDQSLRFDGSSSYLTKTPSSDGNRRKWTFSAWIKFSQTDDLPSIFGKTRTGNNREGFALGSSQKLQYQLRVGSTTKALVESEMMLRDTTNWYHIMMIWDSDNATASNRVIFYVNGQNAGLEVYTSPVQNTDSYINSTNQNYIGWTTGGSNYLHGYMAEVNFVDGQALTPSSFGETKNGVWIPKEYSSSYGGNGFRLTFADSSALGDDTSGNGNDYTSSGLASTDVVPDSPTNNFCTLSSIQNQTSATLSEGSLKAVGTSANWDNLQSTFAVSSGKWYWEVKATSVSEANSFVAGIHETSFPAQSLFWFSGSYTTSAYGTAFGVLDPDNKVTNGSATAFTLGLATNDIIQFRLNLDDNELSVSIDGSDKGKIYDITANVEYTPALSLYNTSSATMNFGQDSTFAGTETAGGNADANGKGDFKYSVPSGYLALCSANLPDTTISPNQSEQADDHFNTILWDGNSSFPRALTGVGFKPDWIWTKTRNQTYGHGLFDSSRGASAGALSSQNTNAEPYAPTNFDLDSFDSDGMTWASTADLSTSNNSGDNYVAWNWKANGGTTSSNTDGTITSTVQANTTAGFSIVTYTGTGTQSDTVGHGLGAKPKMVFVKSRSEAQNWHVYHEELDASAPENYILPLNASNAKSSSSADFWNSTAPTTTVMSVGDDNSSNKLNQTYVMYCFAEVEGYSKFGQYTGNSSSDGTYVHLAFRPSFIMVRKFSGADNWLIHDNARDPDNVVQKYLLADSANTEASDNSVDFLSNGFKWRLNSGARNTSGQTYIYMAFSDGQTAKFSNAR